MPEQELEIEISPAGKVTMRSKGIKGQACMDYADLLVQILGREEQREKTGEYYEAAEQIQRRIDVKQRR
ncbi:MAG TPA: DUF2997 domain-containing protein [Tepidisphaeraceae bacterium]|nr:DUF2997 domain-containing protein [Tepidisphaeraceae bacterium]